MATNEEVRAAFLRGDGQPLKSRSLRYRQNAEGLNLLFDSGTLVAVHFGDYVYNMLSGWGDDAAYVRRQKLADAVCVHPHLRRWPSSYYRFAITETSAPSEVCAATTQPEPPPLRVWEQCEILAEEEAAIEVRRLRQGVGAPAPLPEDMPF